MCSVTIYGKMTLMAESYPELTLTERLRDGIPAGKDMPVPEVIPVNSISLTEEDLDKFMASGALKPGAFNNLQVSPPVTEWEPRHRCLKQT